MCNSFNVAWRGSRIPCSQLSTAFELTFSKRASNAWLAFRLARRARISAGFSGLGRAGNSAWRRSRLLFAGFAAASGCWLCFFLSFFLSFLPTSHPFFYHIVVLPQCRILASARKWPKSARDLSTLLPGRSRYRAPLVPHLHIRPRCFVVVGKYHQPLFRNRLGVELVPVVNAGQRVKVVSHHPCGIEMVSGRNQIAGIADGRPSAAHDHDLHVTGVPRENPHRDPRRDLGIALEQRHLAILD